MTRWNYGDTILARHIFRNKVWYAIPAFVVDDSSDRLVTFFPAGTKLKITWVDFNKGSIDGPCTHFWHTNDVLTICEYGALHSVSLFWKTGGCHFANWYIDFQDPMRRTPDGIVTFDRSLDIVVSPDMKWRWKDEDHYRRIQELGWITSEMVELIEKERQIVVERIENRENPFSEPWQEWRPDSSWTIPELPSDWAKVTE